MTTTLRQYMVLVNFNQAYEVIETTIFVSVSSFQCDLFMTTLHGMKYRRFLSNLGIVLPNNQLKCKKWLGNSKNNISKPGSFKLLGWLANPILILIFLGKQSQELP